MGTKDYDSPFCRGLFFCTQFKNTFALSILTYPQKQHSQTGVCCFWGCPQIIIPSGKSILLLGIFMPFGAVKGGQSHENNQYYGIQWVPEFLFYLSCKRGCKGGFEQHRPAE